jgi:hypothetical protein
MPSKSKVLERTGQRAKSALSFQRRLSAWNSERLSAGLPSPDWMEGLLEEAGLLALEGQFVEQESRAVSERVATAPQDADAFVAAAIAEGALLRLTAGARCFERYRQELRFDAELGICA